MIIRKISKIKKLGVFRNFAWDTNIPVFRKHNLLYGWNYSGKTLISRIFRSFDTGQKHPDYLDAEFELIDENDGRYTDRSDDLIKLPLVRVFNTDFIQQNLKWHTPEENIEPIFILGEENIELQNELEKSRAELELLKKNKEEMTNEKNDTEIRIEKELTAKAREIKNTLAIPNYNKNRLKEVIKEIADNHGIYLLSNNAYSANYSTFKSIEQKETLSLPEIPIHSYSDILKTAKQIIGREISAEQIIKELKDNERINTWVREGKIIHEGKDKCYFCGNKLPSDLFDKLNKHFSTEYEQLEEDIASLLGTIEDHKKETENIKLPNKTQFYAEYANKYYDHYIAIDKLFQIYLDNIVIIINKLDGKRKRPFVKHEINGLSDNSNYIAIELEEIQKVIDNHNAKTDNFAREREIAKTNLLRNSAAQFMRDHNYLKVKDRIGELEKKLLDSDLSIKKVVKNINIMDEKLSDSVKGAVRINTYIQQLFYHAEIKLEVSENDQFVLLRNGEPARNLSEGEKTAISLAYFIARLEDKNTELDKAIVFIDDPISSLDCNHLFNVNAFIKNKLRDCGQLFISTHNFEFFNLVKDFLKYECSDFDGKGYGSNLPCYLVQKILRKDDSNGGQSIIKVLPTALMKHRSEYNYLFSILRDFREKGDEQEMLELLYIIPNIIRRFLEGYLSIKKPDSRKMKEKLKDYKLFSDHDKEQVVKLIDEYSHESSMDHSFRFPDAFECRQVIEIVLNSLRDFDKDHYDSLCED